MRGRDTARRPAHGETPAAEAGPRRNGPGRMDRAGSGCLRPPLRTTLRFAESAAGAVPRRRSTRRGQDQGRGGRGRQLRQRPRAGDRVLPHAERVHDGRAHARGDRGVEALRRRDRVRVRHRLPQGRTPLGGSGVRRPQLHPRLSALAPAERGPGADGPRAGRRRGAHGALRRRRSVPARGRGAGGRGRRARIVRGGGARLLFSGPGLLEQGVDLGGHNALPRLLQAVAGLPRLGLQFQRLGESGLRRVGPPLFKEAEP